MNNEKAAENKMGVLPIKKLVISMSLPMMISMLVQALYNIVDSVFVARVSEGALTAVSLAFPVQTILIGMGVGMGVGMNALLSRSLGEKNKKMVDASAMNGLFLSLMNFIIFVFVGLLLVRPFYEFQSDDAEIVGYGIQYLRVVCCCSLGIFYQTIFERLLQSTGKTVLSMISQMFGAIINLILDPILIFGLLGAPRLEVAGAAIATVTGQTLAAVLGLILNLKFNKEITFSLRGFKPNLHVIGNIYKVGFPSIIMQSIGSIMVFCMNRILMAFSSTAVAVFGVYFKMQSFIFMPVFGLNSGIVPVIAYNYGAGKRKRVTGTMKFAMLIAFCIMSVGTLLFELIPHIFFSLFGASDNMMSMGVVALRIIAVHFPVAAFCIILTSTFQALGNAVYSLIISIMRQIVVLLPAAYILSLSGNVNNVWWAFPIAEIASLICCLFFFARLNKKVISRIGE